MWIAVGLGIVAGGTGVVPRTRRIAPRVHLGAAIVMAIAVASFGVFTIIVAPLGDQYGI